MNATYKAGIGFALLLTLASVTVPALLKALGWTPVERVQALLLLTGALGAAILAYALCHWLWTGLRRRSG